MSSAANHSPEFPPSAPEPSSEQKKKTLKSPPMRPTLMSPPHRSETAADTSQQQGRGRAPSILNRCRS
ncbi:hypothetical protein [Halomicronema hongdechloris]|uniref:hypothetical protein n=1 Tax=Halomicronema hongdechloris TaxID=1209493 RepID=UPI0010CB71CE|nr:hypothetical protein [Halomicronema hongdechloris]